MSVIDGFIFLFGLFIGIFAGIWIGFILIYVTLEDDTK
jgi:hypothetical protein